MYQEEILIVRIFLNIYSIKFYHRKISNQTIDIKIGVLNSIISATI